MRGAQLAPRVSVTRQQGAVAAAAVDVDTPDLFPDECLIHEDCDQVRYHQQIMWPLYEPNINILLNMKKHVIRPKG